MNGKRPSHSAPLSWWAVPVAAYLAITLGVPLANGAARQPSFWEHALVVAVTTGALVAAAALARATWVWLWRRRSVVRRLSR